MMFDSSQQNTILTGSYCDIRIKTMFISSHKYKAGLWVSTGSAHLTFEMDQTNEQTKFLVGANIFGGA